MHRNTEQETWTFPCRPAPAQAGPARHPRPSPEGPSSVAEEPAAPRHYHPESPIFTGARPRRSPLCGFGRVADDTLIITITAYRVSSLL